MDVNSGSIHVVDDVVYDLIPLVEALVGEGVKEINAVKAALRERESISWPEDILEEALEEVLDLEAAGLLFAPDIYENYVYDLK